MTLDPTARKRILVVANNTCPCESLHQEIRSRSGDGNSEVLIVAPALNKRIRHYVSDTGEPLRRQSSGWRGRSRASTPVASKRAEWSGTPTP